MKKFKRIYPYPFLDKVKINKLPWFQIIVLAILILILLIVLNTNKIANKAFREARDASNEATEVKSQVEDNARTLQKIRKDLKEVCLTIGAPCTLF